MRASVGLTIPLLCLYDHCAYADGDARCAEDPCPDADARCGDGACPGGNARCGNDTYPEGGARCGDDTYSEGDARCGDDIHREDDARFAANVCPDADARYANDLCRDEDVRNRKAEVLSLRNCLCGRAHHAPHRSFAVVHRCRNGDVARGKHPRANVRRLQNSHPSGVLPI